MGLIFDLSTATRCFDVTPAGKDGDRLARYWLSLWREGFLPMRADFRPRDITDLLPAISIFDVVPNVSVRCRLMGSLIAQGAGRDITGLDWIALTPAELRAERLARFSHVARGAIGRGLRSAQRTSGEIQLVEEIMLPFGDVGDGGVHQVLTYIGWQPSLYDPTITGVASNSGLLLEFQLTSLLRETATAA